MNHGQDIIFVTGPAGAGGTTAIKILEDFGLETIDNLPLNMVKRILSGSPSPKGIAIGIGTRTRGFSCSGLLDLIDSIKETEGFSATLLYLDCSKRTLLQRFSETRRRHPASPDGTARLGIEYENERLRELKRQADILVDTSGISPHQLRGELERRFMRGGTVRLSVSVQSFSYKRGVPQDADMMFDCRFLRNPHWQANLRALTGQAAEVGKYISEDPLFTPFFTRLTDFVELLLPAYQGEGKAYLSIALGCTGGQHRSVFVAEKLTAHLQNQGWEPRLRHNEMQRWPETEAKT